MTDVPQWVTLTDGEELVWQSNPSPLPYIASLVGEVILIALGLTVWLTGGVSALIGMSYEPAFSVVSLSFWALVGIVLILWGGLGILNTGLKWWSRQYVLTSKEVYKKTGILRRSVKNTRLADIQNTTFSQSILGRLASYGTVEIFTAGTGGREIAFEHVPDPNAVVSTIVDHRSTNNS